MSKSELRQLFDTVASVYPFFVPSDEHDIKVKLSTWYEILKNQPYDKVHDNFIRWASENERAPLPVNLMANDSWRKGYEVV